MANGTIAKKLPSANQILEPSPFQLMMRRIFGHAGMTFGGGVLILIFAAALLAPILSPHDPYTQDLTFPRSLLGRQRLVGTSPRHR